MTVPQLRRPASAERTRQRIAGDERPQARPAFAISSPVGGSVVHIAAECWPYAKTGGLGEAVSTLASHHHGLGIPTAIMLPLYQGVLQGRHDIARVRGDVIVRLGTRRERIRLWQTRSNGAPRVTFIDHPVFSERTGIYGDDVGDYADNAERFALFCAAALTVLPDVAPRASVIHAHDWHAALALVYLRTNFAWSAVHQRLAGVLSVHNAAFQGHVSPECMPALGLAPELFDWRRLEWYGHVNILKGGLAFADAVATVSATHARELTEPAGGFGLDGVFAALGDRLVGIVNGIDQGIWDPATDPSLAARYSSSSLAGKRRCKAALQRELGLRDDPDIPIAAMCARMTDQKGVDQVLESGVLSRRDVQFVFLGHGEPRYLDALRRVAAESPDRIAAHTTFEDRLEHVLMAGADLFLMPSRYEPCGLAQMRAQRYGAIPVARRVGGLADTIDDGVTGFLYDACTPAALDDALRGALVQYRDKRAWQRIMRAAMTRDFGWTRSAMAYHDLYRAAVARAQAAAHRGDKRT